MRDFKLYKCYFQKLYDNLISFSQFSFFFVEIATNCPSLFCSFVKLNKIKIDIKINLKKQ